jgi:dipeptidyl-peptidase 4
LIATVRLADGYRTRKLHFMRHSILGLLALLLPIAGLGPAQPIFAAENNLVETQYLRDYAKTRGFMLGRPVKAQPTPDGKAVLFLRSAARSPALGLYEFDVGSGKTRELLTPEKVLKGAAEKLSPEEKARRERQRVSVGGFTSYHLSPDGKRILLSLSGKLYLFERAGGAVSELPTGPGTLLDPKFSPDGKSVSYVRDQDVYVLDLAESRIEYAVTAGGTERVTHGLAEFVAQEEMDRYTGYWWSPDSRFIAYEEADATDVESWYVADPSQPGRPPLPSFYPRPGNANVKARLGIVPAHGGKTVWVAWDHARYPYLATVHWRKGGPLVISVQTRDQHELLVLRVDGATGKTTRLLSERDPAWVNLHPEMPYWLEDGSGFLWTTERDGGPQLELRNPDGRLRRALVPASAGFQGLADVDLEKKEIVYNASPNPTQSQLFRMSLEREDDVVQVTKGTGLFDAKFAQNHAVYVLTARLLHAMPRSTVLRSDDITLGELPSVAEKPPFEPRVKLLKVGPGQGFYAAVIRPRDFDPKKRYPVIVDVYGGPHFIYVLATMNRWLLDQWYADQGFIVVSMDGRGTPGRGRDWERSLYQKFGSVPLDDQVAALQALGKRFPEMDLQRIGIDGWSFGGYLSALAVLRRPDIFKAAVAGAPVADWHDYDTHYTERYLGVPPAAEAAYDKASLLTYASQLRRPLLILHGTADDNVYFRHSLRLAQALFRAGKDFEILPLPGLTHMVPDPVVMERLHSRIAEFFQKHLGRPK